LSGNHMQDIHTDGQTELPRSLVERGTKK
jgi:hypothetical protein